MCLTTPPNKAATKRNCTYSKVKVYTILTRSFLSLISSMTKNLGTADRLTNARARRAGSNYNRCPAVKIFT